MYFCQKIASSLATQKPNGFDWKYLVDFQKKKRERCSFKRFLNPLHSGYRGGEKVKR
jgi:hypothetical protein